MTPKTTSRRHPLCPPSLSPQPVISPTLTRGKRPRGSLCVDLSNPDHRLNLRLDPDGTTLRSAGSLALLTPVPGHVHVEGGLMRMPDGEECHVVYRDGSLMAYRGTDPSVIAPMDSAPRFVLQAEDGYSIIVMPHGSQPRLYRYDPATEAWSQGELFPSLPAITLVRNDMTTLSVPIPALTLKGSYGTSSRSLTRADAESVSTALSSAYQELAAQAAARNLLLQPVVARYRLRALDGSVVYTSAPVIVGADSGFQATRSRLELSGDNGRQASLAPLTATLYSIGHTFSAPLPEQWSRLLQGVEILVSPQLHPFVESLPSRITHVSSSATLQTFTATLPGTDGDGCSSLHSRAVPALLDHEEDSTLWLPLATRRPLSLKEETALIDTLLKTPATYPDEHTRLERRLSPPHAFTAGAGARNGDLIAWGNLEVLPFSGYSPAEMVMGRVHSEWPACPTAATVTMADGSVHVRSITLSNTEIASFSPLLTYPSPDAVQLTLIAGRKCLTVNLRPSPSGRYAYWIAADPAPLTPADTLPAFLLPAAVEKKCTLPGVVVVSRAEEPLRPLAAALTEASSLLALHATPRLANSLNSVESRFYALGTGGVYSVSPTSSCSRLRISCIDRRPLLSSRLSTEIPGGIAALLDGSLVSFAGTKVREILPSLEGFSLAWNGRHGELWLSRTDSAEALVTDLTGSDCWRRLLPTPGATLYSSGSPGRIISADGHIYDLASEGAMGGISVELNALMETQPSPGERALLSLPLYGIGITGSLTLSACHHPAGTGSAIASATARLFTLSFPRAVTPAHPLMESFIFPHCHYLTLRLRLFGSAINLPLSRP